MTCDACASVIGKSAGVDFPAQATVEMEHEISLERFQAALTTTVYGISTTGSGQTASKKDDGVTKKNKK